MAAIPNRYYNSPWIAEAGANLASALAPPDPEKTLAAQRNKWQFDRAQEMARMQDEEYAQKGVRTAALGDIITAHGSPEEGTGYPNQAADDAAIDAALQKAIQAGVPINDAMLAAGTRSRKYMQQDALAQDKYAAQAGNLDRRLDQTLDIFTAGEIGRNNRASMTDDRVRDLAASLEAWKREQLDKQEAGKNARDANNPGGGTALDISPTDDLNLGYAVDDWAEKFGVKLPQDQYRFFKAQAARIYQNTRNSTTAVDEVGRKMFGDKPAVTPAYEPLGPDLWRDPTPATLQLREGLDMGDIAAGFQSPQAAAPAQAPAAGVPGVGAPAQQQLQPTRPGAPREGQRAVSKKGRPMIYVNGQWELELK